MTVEPAAMVLYGPVPDQAALGGLLDRILSSGLVGLLSEAVPR